MLDALYLYLVSNENTMFATDQNYYKMASGKSSI